jgi:chloramphenicol O-acetyltransferase type A
MRQLDMQTWPRREHFRLYSAFDQPHFSLSANVDLTRFYPAVKERGVSVSVALVYTLARAANAIPAFRYRIRGANVVEHETVHPSFTVLADGEVFSFCMVEYTQAFSEFSARAVEMMAHVQANPTLEDEPGRDDFLFMTAIPWVSFTGIMHPLRLHPADSVPRIAWGKFFQDGPALRMPLAVQGHHALMDGLHVGQYYAHVQEILDHPDFLVDNA